MKRIFVVCLVGLLVSTAVYGGVVALASGEKTGNSTNGINSQQSFDAPQDSGKKVFYGEWKISKVAAYGRVNAGEEVARKWLGDKVTFSADKASVDDNTLENPDYQERRISEKEFFNSGGYISFEKLGIKATFIDKVTVHNKKTNQEWDTAWGRFYIKDHNTLLVRTEGVCFEAIRVAASPNPAPVQLSEEKRKELSVFFSTFTYAYLRPFDNGKMTDAGLVSFALHRIRTERGLKSIKRWDDRYWAVPAHDVDDMGNKYFGRSVKIHQSVPDYPFEEGYYLCMYGWGEASPFAQLQSLYDNGDGTFTAIIWEYVGHDIDPKKSASIQSKPNVDGSYTATFIQNYPDGTSDVWKRNVDLTAEYKAIIKPVGEGRNKRYILLEYLKTRKF